MQITHIIGYCMIMAFFMVLPASAGTPNDWKNQTINNEFTVLLPPNWSNFPINSFAGPAYGIMDNSDISHVIGIQIYNNSNCSEKLEENLAVNLQSFNGKTGITNLTPLVYGTNDVSEYGKNSDGMITNVFLRLFEGSVVAVFETYENEDDARKKTEQFALISKSVTPLYPASNDFCTLKNENPTPVPTATYKPRPVPTVKNTVKPTPLPTSSS